MRSIYGFLLAGVFLNATSSNADTQVQDFTSSWTVMPSGPNGIQPAAQWQYQPYQPWDKNLGTLSRVELSVMISGSRSIASESVRITSAFFTGWAPADYQVYEVFEIAGGASGLFSQRTRIFEGEGLADWLTYDYLPRTSYFLESKTLAGGHSLFARTTLTYHYSPPDGVVILDVPSGVQTQGQVGRDLISGTDSISKRGAGTLVVDQMNTMTGSTTVQGGVLQLGHGKALAASQISVLRGTKLTLTQGLATTIGGLVPNAGGLVDVGTGIITVTNGLSSFALYNAITQGRGAGAWDGATGVTSSAVNAGDGTRAVGWLDQEDGSVSFGYAAFGDTNLDWSVDILDVANLIGSGKLNSGRTASWADGDSNYDGLLDILDVANLQSTGLYNQDRYNGAVTGFAVVPEPALPETMLAAASVACLRALCQKRQNRGERVAESTALRG